MPKRTNNPYANLEARARRLAPPQKGKMVTVPVELLPFYLRLHNKKIVSLRGDTMLIEPIPDEVETIR
jgi:hypothetical protein